ncbi:MAG: hypothetical protein GH150_00975 [Hadesarchaea archaeon]|nr:hypothetical protein [Hadesarchaea archaeon]
MCEVEGKDPRLSDIFNFGCYKHGPYSTSLTSNINGYQASNTIKIETKHKNGKTLTSYYLITKGKQEVTNFFNNFRNSYFDIKRVMDKYGRWGTDDLLDLIHKNFVDFVENPTPLKEKAEAMLDAAERYEKEALSSAQDEIITYSMITTILGELFLKLSAKAKTNIANSSSETKNKHFQKWCRFLNNSNKIYGFLHRTEFKIPNKEILLFIQNYVLSLAIEAEKYELFPTDKELLSNVPKGSIEKLEEITSKLIA